MSPNHRSSGELALAAYLARLEADDATALHAALYQYKVSNSLSYQGMAERLGVSDAQVHNLIKGSSNYLLRPSTVEAIARLLGWSEQEVARAADRSRIAFHDSNDDVMQMNLADVAAEWARMKGQLRTMEAGIRVLTQMVWRSAENQVAAQVFSGLITVAMQEPETYFQDDAPVTQLWEAAARALWPGDAETD